MSAGAFRDALAWHQHGEKTAPTAGSVQHTASILRELDRALLLLALTENPPAPVRDFLAIHSEAPYQRG